MRIHKAVIATIALATLIACGDSSDGPGSPDGGEGPAGSVTVGSGIQFVSRHNGSVNPAVDTVAVGDTVTWTWSGNLPHNVRSVGAPAFASSPTFTGDGTYRVVFTTPGVYVYDCVVHGAAMTGRIVVVGVTISTTGNPAHGHLTLGGPRSG
jgi:plastocyanin